MPLKTLGSSAASRFFMAALEPPGNVAAQLALFRRQLFLALDAPSSLAFPEVLPLAFALSPAAAAGKPSRRRTAQLLEAAWAAAVEDRFGFGGLVVAEGSLYARIEGPLAALAAALRAALAEAGFVEEASPPLVPALGFFLCRAERAELALERAGSLAPPPLSFNDAGLVLLRFDCGPDPFAALYWKELIRSVRKTGKPR